MSDQSTSISTEIKQAVPSTAATLTQPLSASQMADIAVDLNSSNLPSLNGESAEVLPVSLAVNYWSPENPGEKKRCWVLGIGESEMTDMVTGELKNLECVFLVAEDESGNKERFMTASKKLVGMIKSAIQRNEIVPKTKRGAVEITYTGLKQNKRNAFKSANWEIKPLLIG